MNDTILYYIKKPMELPAEYPKFLQYSSPPNLFTAGDYAIAFKITADKANYIIDGMVKAGVFAVASFGDLG